MKVSEMKLFYILFFCLPMVACRYGADIRSELSRAETLLQDAPDSALNILQSIEPDKIRKDRIRAEYALLYSMALDKNYIMVESDSLIRIARNFYHDSGDIRRRYLSDYYYGLVLYNRQEHAEALVHFLAAEDDCLKLGDPYLSGLLYTQISNIYRSAYDYSNSLVYIKKAYDNYRRAGKTRHCGYALSDIGDAYAQLERPDSAEFYYLSSLDITESVRDTAMMRATLCYLALVYINNKEPEKAATTLWRIRRQSDTDWDAWEYVVMATAQQMMNHLDSALYYLKQADIPFDDSRGKAHWRLSAANIHMKTGEYRKAAEEYQYCAAVQDSLVRIALQQSYASLHRDFISERQHATMSALYAMKHRFWLSAMAAAIFILFVGYIAYINYRKRQQTRAQYIEAIGEIRKANQLLFRKLEKRKMLETQELRHLMKERFGVVSELAATYYERRGTDEQKAIFGKVKALLDSYASDKKGKEEIEKAVNLCYDDVMVKIRQELPSLKESELDLLRYIYAGFSLRVISVFTGDSLNYTAVKKSRLKAKIAASDAPSKACFIDLMS